MTELFAGLFDDAALFPFPTAAELGTCSVLGPVDDPVRLSLLPTPERIPA